MKHATFAAAILLLAGAATAEAWPGKNGHGGKHFKKMDKDEDGLVTFEEFELPGKGFLAYLDEEGQEDAGLTLADMQARAAERFAEKQAWMAERHAEMSLRMAERFAEADANEDGRVTAEEARQAAFSRMDSNEDGYIDADEAKEARKGWHGKGRHGRGWHKRHGGR